MNIDSRAEFWAGNVVVPSPRSDVDAFAGLRFPLLATLGLAACLFYFVNEAHLNRCHMLPLPEHLRTLGYHGRLYIGNIIPAVLRPQRD
jgi:hypothetical protein